jgi:hypothetical protein
MKISDLIDKLRYYDSETDILYMDGLTPVDFEIREEIIEENLILVLSLPITPNFETIEKIHTLNIFAECGQLNEPIAKEKKEELIQILGRYHQEILNLEAVNRFKKFVKKSRENNINSIW